MTGPIPPSIALVALAALPAWAAEGKRIEIEGKLIDTWCYFSGAMGGPETVDRSAHHACARWCAADGFPVGLIREADYALALTGARRRWHRHTRPVASRAYGT